MTPMSSRTVAAVTRLSPPRSPTRTADTLALFRLATSADSPNTRMRAARMLGNVPSVAALDMLRGLATSPDPSVRQVATPRLCVDVAHRLHHASNEAPREVNRCLRDLICDLQDDDDKANAVLAILSRRTHQCRDNLAEHLTALAATCYSSVALGAWQQLCTLAQSDPHLHTRWCYNLSVLRRAAHAHVAAAARAYNA